MSVEIAARFTADGASLIGERDSTCRSLDFVTTDDTSAELRSVKAQTAVS